MVAFLDYGRMTSDLAEFLLQLHGELSQGSTNAGALYPGGVCYSPQTTQKQKGTLYVVL